ncbi:MAG: TerC family protein [Verrucomicrobia subdivision 3 bacterium]|nr:TerC family protein [Limisphaerales bacterium]
MFAAIEITPWHWVGFVVCVVTFLALDLGVFHRKARVVRFKEAIAWTTLWFSLAMAFAAGLVPMRGKEEAMEFLTGYLIELSLSMDNVFVIALIFAYFRVPSEYQHRVLFWGILGALVMRGVMIGAGAALVERFHWMLYVFGAFLVYSGVKMLFVDEEGVHPEKNPFIKLARRFLPVSHEFDGQRFLTVTRTHTTSVAYAEAGGQSSLAANVVEVGQRALTPLALVLVMVETTDLVFALDSIPAIFGITTKKFIVFTSNVFAILGLRSLYFVLAGAIEYFRYLKYGLSIVLIFIGVKMLAEIWNVKLSTTFSLGVVAGIIVASIVFSIVAARHERNA